VDATESHGISPHTPARGMAERCGEPGAGGLRHAEMREIIPAMTLRVQCAQLFTAPIRIASLAFWQDALDWRRTHEDLDGIVLEPPEGSPEDGVAPEILL
jgi:hypothetical protein